MESKRPVVCWFRRDLRVEDNPALFNASAGDRPVIPLFVVDEDLVARIPSDGAAFDFQSECLHDLSDNLEKLGTGLVVRGGKLKTAFAQIIEEAKPEAVYFNRDYDPDALDRDKMITDFLESQNVGVKSFDDVVIHPPDEVTSSQGGPYTVFTPYSAKWKKLRKPAPVGKPNPVLPARLRSDPIPGAKDFGRQTTIFDRSVRGGETAAKEQWSLFLREILPGYADSRDYPARKGTSMMSAYLRFGCISPVRMYSDLRALEFEASSQERNSVEKYVGELVWREFYISALYYFPFTALRNYRRMFDGVKWPLNERLFAAWKEGRTGFPLVDAAMRQLNATGWMHNRVRMVVASFLTKDLHIDWRWGEEYFARKLIDIEKASNVGGWQWSASTGVDPAPLRIFNPVLQSRRFDEDGQYIKTWLPELGAVPARYIHQPDKMNPAFQKEIGVVIGKNYPAPVADHREAAAVFKLAYIAAKEDERRSKFTSRI